MVAAHGADSIRRFYPGVSQDIFNGIHESFTTRPLHHRLFRQLIRKVQFPYQLREELCRRPLKLQKRTSPKQAAKSAKGQKLTFGRAGSSCTHK